MKRPVGTLALCLAATVAGAASAPPHYTAVDLGTLGGGIHAADVNDAGWVVGSSFVVDQTVHAFLWLPGPALGLPAGIHDLGTLGNFDFSSARAIDAAGRVVGNSYLSSSPIYRRGFSWEQGTISSLGTLDIWPSSWAEGVNDVGDIAGGVSVFGCLPILWLPEPRYGLPAGINELPTLNLDTWPDGWAYDINNHGQVVGFLTRSCDAADSYHPYLWLPEPAFGLDAGPHDLLPEAPNLGCLSTARAINDLGEIVGYRRNDLDLFEPLLWRAGVAETLPLPPGSDSALARDLNENGQIVGNSGDFSPASAPHALLWQDGQVYDLNDLVGQGSGWDLRFATAINRSGQIVGTGLHDGEPRAFLLTPVDVALEIPTLGATGVALLTLLLAGAGAVLLALRRPVSPTR